MTRNISLIHDPYQHTMEDSLQRYLEIKMHHLLLQKKPYHIKIVGEYDRSNIISKFEKTGKMFNWKRPTVSILGDLFTVKTFPGHDYVEHYASIISSYFAITRNSLPEITYVMPTEEACYRALYQSNLPKIEKYDYAILGTVEQLTSIVDYAQWIDEGDFMVSSAILNNKARVALVGCKFSIWGDIAGRVVDILAERRNKNVIYIGKVGGLKPNLTPNMTLATGNESLVNNKIIKWDNLFSNVHIPLLIHGKHFNSYSILAENKHWHHIFKDYYDFVDPEIGYMAVAAQNAGIGFGFLHIISNNLSSVHAENLSNERKDTVQAKRHKLILTIADIVRQSIIGI